MNRSTPGLPVHHQLAEFTQTHVHRVSDAIQHSHPLLLLPSIFPTIRVFLNESVLRIRWPRYWSFSFGTSPSNEYSRLISFGIDWFDLLALQGHLGVTIIVFLNIDAPFKIQEFFTHVNLVSYLLEITQLSIFTLQFKNFIFKN